MRLLYAPYNIASMPAITLDALKRIPGMEVKGVAIMNQKSQSFGDDPFNTWKRFNVYGSLRNPFSFLMNCILAEFYLCKRILWAEAIIWQWDTRIYLPHFWFLKFCSKPILVEWVGDDIREPELLMKYNSYFKQVFEDGTYSYPKISLKRSIWIQRKFKFLGAIPYLCPEMTLFLDRKLFPFYISAFQRIDVKKYKAVYPDPLTTKIRIAHTPSAKGAKGTHHVRNAIEKLKSGFDIEYIEIHGKTHEDALEAIASADIFLDQFIGGSYGMATCEGLSLGKPVFCYLMDPFIKLLPEDCPIVNANADTLENVLSKYLSDPQLRHDTGKRSRAYAEKYHDVDKIALELVGKLKEVL